MYFQPSSAESCTVTGLLEASVTAAVALPEASAYHSSAVMEPCATLSSASPLESSHFFSTLTDVVSPLSNLPWKGRVCVSPVTVMLSAMNVPQALPRRFSVAPGARMLLTMAAPVMVAPLAL